MYKERPNKSIWFGMVIDFNGDKSFYSWKYKSLVIVSRKHYNLVNIRSPEFIINDKQRWICLFFIRNSRARVSQAQCFLESKNLFVTAFCLCIYTMIMTSQVPLPNKCVSCVV